MKMKSFITTLFLLLAMTCNVMAGELSGPKSNEVQEVTGPFTIIITGNGVIGRDGPGGVDTGVRFYKGQKLTCYGLEKGWYKVKYGNGVRWVSSEYAKVESTTSPPSLMLSSQATVSSEGLPPLEQPPRIGSTEVINCLTLENKAVGSMWSMMEKAFGCRAHTVMCNNTTLI